MSKDIRASLQEKLYECDQHVQKITTAKQYLQNIMPLTLDAYQQLDDVQKSFIDQLIFRFSKLQDSMGEKLFPAVLILSEEDVKKKTFLDVLTRLEELGLVTRQEWLRLREIRNEIAHEYTSNQENVVVSIVMIYEQSDSLIELYQRIVAFMVERFKIEHWLQVTE
jgi:hypothetical protein